MTAHPRSPGSPKRRIVMGSETVVSVEYRTVAVSARRTELLELAYRHVLEHGLTGMSLRPLAKAIGSSPRVLLYCFESKEGLVQALLARAREDELERIARIDVSGGSVRDVASEVWDWLAAPEHRPLLRVWVESYSRSLSEPDGPWAGFAAATVADWLAVLEQAQPPELRGTPEAVTERTLILAVLRGATLDLLATGDHERTSAAVAGFLRG
jgi:AcrR family transcriptional regulator